MTVDSDDFLQLTGRFAIADGGPASVTVRVGATGCDGVVIPMERCVFSESRSGVFVLKSVIDEDSEPADPTATATAASSFTMFGSGSSASVGSLMVGIVPDLLTATPLSATVSPKQSVLLLSEVEPGEMDKDMANVTFSGKFDFASKVTVDASADCDGVETATDLRMMDSDDNVMDTTEAVAVSRFLAGLHLCITVDSTDADLDIPKTSAYSAMTSYTGLADATFSPMGRTHTLGIVDRDGTTIRIGYLYADMSGRFKHRVIIRNRGREVPYEFEFNPPEGTDASMRDGASGMLPADSTTVLLAGANGDLVTLSNGVETAATFTADADPTDIDLTTFLLDPVSGAPNVVEYEAD